jgi:hypothetical protein
MRSSFSGVTFTPGRGVEVWSRGEKVDDFTSGRHLVWDATNENTICGLRIGVFAWSKLGRRRVHWSKARKVDCPVCRAMVRTEIHERREKRCPKIPPGYGTHPADCACGGCPETKAESPYGRGWVVLGVGPGGIA